MKIDNSLSFEDKQSILELYLMGDDRREILIAAILNIDVLEVERVIQDYLYKKIRFERGNFIIKHSSINYKS